MLMALSGDVVPTLANGRRAEREVTVRPERPSFNGEPGQVIMVPDPGGRERQAKSECFPWRDTLVPAGSCVQVRYREEV